MNLGDLKINGIIFLIVGLAGMGFETIAFGGRVPVLFFLAAIIAAFSAQVLLLSAVADAMVNTLNEKKKKEK